MVALRNGPTPGSTLSEIKLLVTAVIAVHHAMYFYTTISLHNIFVVHNGQHVRFDNHRSCPCVLSGRRVKQGKKIQKIPIY